MSMLPAGRIDVHSHLLPSCDDGCKSLNESIECARVLVREGYSHAFCTPHVWPNLPENQKDGIVRRVAALQAELERCGVPLTLVPGGELNLTPDFTLQPPERLVTYGMAGKFALADIWVDKLPKFFRSAVQWVRDQGVQLILAHPERMAAVQADPSLADYFADLGLLLQGNLQCIADPEDSPTRRVAEQYLAEGRYFMLGSDTHNLASLPIRMRGLHRAIDLVGTETVDRLTRINPSQLLPVQVA